MDTGLYPCLGLSVFCDAFTLVGQIRTRVVSSTRLFHLPRTKPMFIGLFRSSTVSSHLDLPSAKPEAQLAQCYLIPRWYNPLPASCGVEWFPTSACDPTVSYYGADLMESVVGRDEAWFLARTVHNTSSDTLVNARWFTFALLSPHSLVWYLASSPINTFVLTFF
jgi:hypothetical protein